MRIPILFLWCCLIGFVTAQAADNVIFLDELDLSKATCGAKNTVANKSYNGNRISIGGRSFTRGVSHHASGDITIELPDKCGIQITGWVGVDDEVGKSGHAEFVIYNEKEILWRSGPIDGGQEARQFTVNLTGLSSVRLHTDTLGGYDNDHTDWGEVSITYRGNKKPYTVFTAIDARFASDKPFPLKDFVVTYHTDSMVRIWNYKTGEKLGQFRVGVTDWGDSCLRLSSDCKYLARKNQNVLKVFDLQTGAQTLDITNCESRLADSYSFSPDGKYIATGRNDKCIAIYDLENSKEIKVSAPMSGRQILRVFLAFSDIHLC